MTQKRDYPLLTGGIFLALLVGLLELLGSTFGDWSIYALLLGSVGGVTLWLRYKPTPKTSGALPQAVDTAVVQRALADAEKVITQLGVEVDDPQEAGSLAAKPKVSLFQSQVSQIAADMNREQIRIVVMGAKGTGKTTLIQEMQSGWTTFSPFSLSFSEAPSPFTASDNGASATALVAQQAIAADLVLFLIAGDITESEFQALKQLSKTKRTLLVFNKQDQYLPDERQTLLSQIQRRGREVLKLEDVVAISAAPNPIKVRQHQDDGAVKEWLEDQSADIAALTQRLEQILQQESQQLILASSFTTAQALGVQVKTVLNDVRRTRALPIVEQFQWIAAGTAFASPLPAMDLVATVAINAQMIVDLGKIYRQKFSLQQAQKVATSLGSLMLKLGLVELSTQAVGGLLKSNAITYLAGGCVQGISAAYLTRVTGLSLIEYFSTQEPNLSLNEASPLAIERFTQILQRVFQQNQQTTFLGTLINQAMDRFSASFPKSPISVASDPTLFTQPVEETPPAGTPLLIPLSLPVNPAPELEPIAHNETVNRLAVSSIDTPNVPS